LKFFEYFEDIKKENLPLFLEVEDDLSSAKKQNSIYNKPRNQNSKDEVWKHLWKFFIKKFLTSNLLKQVFY